MSDFLSAAYTHEIAMPEDPAVSGNWIDSIASLPGTVTAGLVAAGTEVLNIPTALASIPINLLGGDYDGKWIRTEEVFGEMDNALGTSLENYYYKHKEGIDMVGFLGASLVPGLAGTKALRAGLGGVAKLENTSGIAKAIGSFESIGPRALAAAKMEIASGSPFSYMNAQAFKVYAAGAGQGVLDALAFNTASTLALHQSAYLEDKSFSELTKDVLFDSVVFGAGVGTFLDVGSKGVGVFGYKGGVRGYADQFAEVKARALAPFQRTGDLVESGAKLQTAKGTGYIISPGDEALLRLNDVKQFEQRTTELKALLDEGILSADNANLMRREMETFTRLREEALTNVRTKVTESIQKIFGEVTDVVDANAIAKQLLDPKKSLDESATILAGITKSRLPQLDELEDLIQSNSLQLYRKSPQDKFSFSLKTIEGAETRMVKLKNPLNAATTDDLYTRLGLDSTKPLSRIELEDAGLAAGYDAFVVGDDVTILARYDKKGRPIPPTNTRTAFLDIVDGKIVNKMSQGTAWDLPKKQYRQMIADMLPDTTDDIVDLASTRTAIENSALYRREIENWNAGRLQEAGNLPGLDILVANKKPSDTIRYAGKDYTHAQAAEIVARRKSELATEMAEKGYNTQQISSALMVPEESMFSPQAMQKNFTTVLDPNAQRPRYIVASYNKSRNLNKFDLEGKVEIAAKTQMAEQQMKAVVASIDPELGAIPDIVMDRYTENFTAGVFSFADAKFGRLFEESLLANSKIFSKIQQRAVEKRVLAVKTSIEKIKSAGVGSADHTEFVVMNAWNKQAKNFGGGNTIAVKTDDGFVLMQRNNFKETEHRMIEELIEAKQVPEVSAIQVLERYLQQVPDAIKGAPGQQGSVFKIRTQSVNDFLSTHIAADARSVGAKNRLANLHGQKAITLEKSAGAFNFYDPNVNLRNAQHVLVIKGDALHQNPLYSGQSYVFAAKSVEDLRKAEAWAAAEGLQTYTKGQTAEFYKMLDEYDASLTFNTGGIKESLQNKGRLTSYVESAQSLEDTATRFLDWHLRDETALYKNAIATKEYKAVGTLKNIDLHERRLLNSRKGSPTRIAALLRGEDTKVTKAEGLLNTLFNTQNPGIVSAVTKAVDDFGMQFATSVRDMFSSFKSQDLDNLNSPASKAMTRWLDNMGVEQYITKDIVESLGVKNYNSPGYANFIRMSNMALVMGQLRLDAINSLVNVIGMPIIGSSTVELAIRSTMERLKKAGRIADMDNLKKVLYQKEGQLGYMPSTYVRMAKQSIGRFESLAKDNPVFGSMAQGDETLAQFFLRKNITFNPAEVAAMDLTEATLSSIKAGETKASVVVDRIKNFLGKITKPTDMVESRIQFIAADAGLQIAEAAKLSPNEAMLLMHTMANKLQGNFNASMKPQLFQGITGSALGLFQSYQARLIHRLSDVITDGNKRMAVEAAMLQTSIFGGRSLPFFDALNNSLVAGSNSDNQDLYSGIYGSMDRNIANALTYGVPSALLGLNLSSRGNATPRFPASMTDIPAVNIWYNQIAQIKDLFTQAANGADISQLFNHAVQHNVFSRPAGQLAVALSGYSTTGNNKLAIDLNDAKMVNENNWLPFNLANFMRISGAKPIDEAVLTDTIYRWQGFELADREKREQLGRAVSSNLLANGQLDPQQANDFMEAYMKAGGTQRGFSSFLKNQAANSNIMAMDRLLKHVKNEPQARQLRFMLGAPTDEEVPGVNELIPNDELN